MSEAKHTPGPWSSFWRVDDKGEADCGIYHERYSGHAHSICRAPKYQTKEQWKADSALICAAPDLLAALKSITAKFTNCARGSGSNQWAIDEATQAARAVIARAEGRTP